MSIKLSLMSVDITVEVDSEEDINLKELENTLLDSLEGFEFNGLTVIQVDINSIDSA